MNEAEERYVHFAGCIESLNEAWALLGALSADPQASFAGPAFRFALILYAKPYKDSFGAQRRRFRLDTRFVPVEHQALHERLISRRDQLHAHTDLTLSDALVHVEEFAEGKRAVLVRNHISPLEDFRDIQQIIALVEGTLDAIYVEARRLEAELPSSP